jgi:HD-GYP domain-containing protein (c-di-GMP phosphodiesterase class II)
VLLRTLRERQPDLHDHLRGVAELALDVGHELGMATEQLDELSRAAELHDIGKVAIPDAILSKPGPLDAGEWAFMRRHTVIGERILGAAPALRPVARLVRASHERWDGDGYPDGLRNVEIPLGARIVAVCDAYHAMTSERPYRDAVTPAEALAELRECAGTQFDPDVVEAFGRLLEQPGAAAEQPTTA